MKKTIIFLIKLFVSLLSLMITWTLFEPLFFKFLSEINIFIEEVFILLDDELLQKVSQEDKFILDLIRWTLEEIKQLPIRDIILLFSIAPLIDEYGEFNKFKYHYTAEGRRLVYLYIIWYVFTLIKSFLN